MTATATSAATQLSLRHFGMPEQSQVTPGLPGVPAWHNAQSTDECVSAQRALGYAAAKRNLIARHSGGVGVSPV